MCVWWGRGVERESEKERERERKRKRERENVASSVDLWNLLSGAAVKCFCQGSGGWVGGS